MLYTEQILNRSQFHQAGEWNNLWKLDVPPKIKQFGWQLGCDVLPTRDRLRRRSVKIAGICGICNGDYETAWHLFLNCPLVRAGWCKLNLDQTMETLQNGCYNMQECLWAVLKHSDRTVQAQILTGIWGIWRERNNRVWNNKSTPIEMVLQGSMNYLNDWKLAQSRHQTSPLTAGSAPCPKWHPPPTGYFKCNVDVATFTAQHSTGWGMAIRDDSGCILHYRMSHRVGNIPVKEGEAIALLEAIQWLSSLNLHHVTIEGDSLQIHQALASNMEDDTEFGDLIRTSRQLMQDLDDYYYCYVRRERNQVAHLLARQSFFHTSPHVGNVPPFRLADVADCICHSAHL
ncbi:Putative ribonuclease H protein At1g65750 [Linum grandiflorum]